MSIDLRKLRQRIAFHRPDFDPTAQIEVATQEAMKDVCRRTFLLRTTVTLDVEADDANVTIPAINNGELLLVHRARFMWNSTEDWKELDATQIHLLRTQQIDSGTPRYFVQERDTIHMAPIPDVAGVLVVQYSWVPTTAVDTVDLPDIAAIAIALKAESDVLIYPPSDPTQVDLRNANRSAQKEREYQASIGNLKAISLYGESGAVIKNPEIYPGAP